jgi:ATP-dependent DNA helicase RecG
MRKYCTEWEIAEPEFREDSGFFKTICYKKPYEEKEIHSLDLSKLEEDDRKIISYLQDHEKATAKELETF